MEKKRYQFIDIARGLAMFCIILGHLGQKDIIRFVFTFHVPIFFLITGFFINQNISVRDFIKKKFHALIVPYAVACAAIILLAVVFNRIYNNGIDDKKVLWRWFSAALYGAGDSYTEPFLINGIGAIWFLLASFWGSIALRCLLKVKTGTRIVSIAVIFFLSCWSRKLFWFPFSIQAAGPALLFMYIGYLAKDILPFIRQISIELKTFFVGVAVWIWIEFIINFQSFWLVHCDYGRGATDIIGSLCACLCVLLFSYWVGKNCHRLANLLAYFGKYSLLMLCMHIIELDVFPWDRWIAWPGVSNSKILFLWIIAGKFIWITAMTVFCSRWNVTRKLFGYSVIDKKLC